MDLIVDEVVQLEEVDPADGDVVVELLAGASVVQLALAVLAQSGLTQGLAYGFLVRAVEDGGGHLPAKSLSRVAEMDLEHLSDVHSGGNAQRIEDYIKRSAVGQVGHILAGQDAGHDTLVTVAAGHLVAHGDLALLSDVDTDDLVYAGAHLIAVFAGEHLYIDDDTALAVRHLERGISHLAGLLAEDGAEQSLLRGQIGLALGSDLADKDIAGTDLSADGDYAALVQILQRIVAHTGDIAGDLLGAELGVARVALVFLDMDGGENVLHDKALVYEDSVLVVVALPGHEADQHILAEGYLALAGAGAVGDNVALVHAVAEGYDWSLVDAGALVGAGKLDELIALDIAAVVLDGDVLSVGADDLAVVLSKDDNAGVHGTLMLDAGGDDGRLSYHEGNSLALHIRAHQSAVCVVVFKEGDHCCRNGNHHSGADVDVIDALAVDLNDLVAVAAGDTLIDKAAVFVAGLGRGSDDVVVLHVGGQVIDLIGHAAGALFNLLEGSDEEAVFICSRIRGEIGDKADVGAFGRLNRAQAAIVAVVNVADVEGGALAAQAAGAEGGHTALMGKLREGVCLVHELGQRAGAEEFLDSRGHGTDIDKALGRYDVQILKSHALADDSLHAGKADAELVLQQLAHAADAAVAEMVDVVLLADAAGKAVEVVDRGEYIVHDDVLGYEKVNILKDSLLESLAFILLHEGLEHDAAYLFLDAKLLGVKVDHALKRHHAV